MSFYYSDDANESTVPLTEAQDSNLGGTEAPRIFAFLYEVDNTQYNYQLPVRQSLGLGYSEVPYHPNKLNLTEIPPWMGPDYPFVEPSSDIEGYVVDAYLSFDDPLHEFEAPIRLERIAKHGADLYSVRFVDANNRVVFESSSYNYTTNSIEVEGNTYIEKARNKKGNCVYKHYNIGWRFDFGTLYELLYWETELVALKMTVRRVTVPLFVIRPESAEMDARALYTYPNRLRSINIKDTIISASSLLLKAGYNMVITPDTSIEIRTKHTITLDASKGSGAGISPAYCDCDDGNKPITMINGIKPTATGSFFFNADPCHSIGGESSVVIGNGCTPCCECRDMSDAGELLQTVEERYYCLGGQTKVVADKLISQINALRARVEEEESEGPSYEYDIQEGNRLFIPFKFVFRNLHKFCIHDLQVTIRVNHVALDYRRLKQQGPVAVEYSDCYIIDEMKEPDVEWNDYEEDSEAESEPVEKYEEEFKEEYEMIIHWKKPIQTMQQVSLVGMYRTNNHFQEYDSWLKDIRYYDECNNEIVLDIDEDADKKSVNYGPWDDMKFEDFTDLLTGDELRVLENEIRQRCLDDEIDLAVRRNVQKG